MVQFERHPHLGASLQQRHSTPHAADVPVPFYVVSSSLVGYALFGAFSSTATVGMFRSSYYGYFRGACRIAGSFRSARMADTLVDLRNR